MAVHNFLVSNLGWETTCETDPHLEKKKSKFKTKTITVVK